MCSTGGASSSDCSGSERISALVTTAFFGIRSLPSQPCSFSIVIMCFSKGAGTNRLIEMYDNIQRGTAEELSTDKFAK